ncbi:hypothetical protein CRUP_009081 [Coryphaenoides rupestris]|nr:hypothetical protein CRUP_009081 [Coryphaenoides rupestris]
MRAGSSGILHWLLLLLACLTGSRAQGGEYCHGWLDGHGNYHEGFQCPGGLRHAGRHRVLRLVRAALLLRGGRRAPRPGRLHQRRELLLLDDSTGGEYAAQPIYVPFLMVGSIFVAFVVVGSLAQAAHAAAHPLLPARLPGRRDHPMILTTAPPSLRTPSRQSSTATTSSSSAGGGSSVRRFSTLLPPPPPPPYTSPVAGGSGCVQHHQHQHALAPGHSQLQLHQTPMLPHPSQGPGFLLPRQYYFPLQPEPYSGAKGFADFGQS